jgi:nitrate reductase gamma subunit
MNPEITSALTQFGTAGLMGWMWLTERRASAARERQLTEAHDRLMSERAHFELLVAAIKENTKVLATLEAGQRSLADVLDRFTHAPRAAQAA